MAQKRLIIYSGTSIKKSYNSRIYSEAENYDLLIDKGKYDSFLVSLNFQNTEMKTVIQTFAEITGENILVGDEIEGNVTATIKDEPWMSALEAILDMKEMDLLIDQETNLMRVHIQHQ